MKKIFLLLLSLLLVLSLFSGCGGPSDNGETTKNGQDGSNTSAAVETTTKDPRDLDDLPDNLDYGNRTIRIVSREHDYYKDEISVDALNGELINDAVYHRNSAVCERLGVNIENTLRPWEQGDGEVTGVIRKQVQSGTHDYDMFVATTYRTVEVIGENLFWDLSQLEYLDLSKPYWSQGFNDAASIGGGYYVINGAICLSMYRSVFATFFNKDIFDDYKIPYLYDVVDEGKWTLDYQYTIASEIYNDLNGNGQRDDADKYGFFSCSNGIMVDPYWSSCQLTILTKTEDDLMQISIDGEKLDSAIRTINHLFWENPGSYAIPNSGDYRAFMAGVFSEDRAAMMTHWLRVVETADVRDMKSFYGIVPMPKYDEAQDDYYSLLHDGVSCVGLPLTLSEEDHEMMGAFMEAMAAESYRTLVPAYYEVALKVKYVSDERSSQMLDRIVANIRIDPGIMYVNATGNFHQKMRSLVGANNNNVASSLKATEKIMQKSVDRINEWVDKLKK